MTYPGPMFWKSGGDLDMTVETAATYKKAHEMVMGFEGSLGTFAKDK
jgi:hypothetical protein